MAQGGLGVGLNLVQQVVQLHHGRVRADSEGVGQGSRFTVWLPLPEQEVAGEQPLVLLQPASAPQASGLRVLVVDDNIDAAETLGALLEFSGHQVQVAHSGAAALSSAATHLPQVVFLDIGLPDISGYEAALALRGMEGMAGARIIALTGWGTPSDKERSSAAGFDQHLTKPVDFNLLLAALT
jgi:CheY-like chemotaxis protein